MTETKSLFIPIGKSEGRYQGILTSTALDRDGEVISRKLIEKWASKDFYIPILLDHQNEVMKNVGYWTNKRIIEKDGHVALLVEPKFLMSNPNAKIVKGMLDEGANLGLSVGFMPNDQEVLEIEGKTVTSYTDGELLEGSFTPVPSNRMTYMQVAKSFNLVNKKEEEKKMDEETVKRIDEFINDKAEYPWDQCIADMKKEGYDEETAAKICAAIKNRAVRHSIRIGIAADIPEAVGMISEKLLKDKIFSYIIDKLLERDTMTKKEEIVEEKNVEEQPEVEEENEMKLLEDYRKKYEQEIQSLREQMEEMKKALDKPVRKALQENVLQKPVEKTTFKALLKKQFGL